jgi:hypothetical protein
MEAGTDSGATRFSRLSAAAEWALYIGRRTRHSAETSPQGDSSRTGNRRGTRRAFRREARALAALNHPNIVTIYSVEQEGDTNFLTMELVNGRSLDTLIDGRGLPLEHVTPGDGTSIAILPFTNLSANPDSDFFGDGLAEEILNARARPDRRPTRGRTGFLVLV